MDAKSQADPATTSAAAIARSRSRYKGSRSHAWPTSQHVVQQDRPQHQDCRLKAIQRSSYNAVEQTKDPPSSVVAPHVALLQAPGSRGYAIREANGGATSMDHTPPSRCDHTSTITVGRCGKIGRSNPDGAMGARAAVPAKNAPSKTQAREKEYHGRPAHVEEAPIPKPAFDAPLSAVNAGERRVAVQYRKAVISLPVTPSTTTTDLLEGLAVQLSVSLDVNEMVVLEAFRQLGLERPVRPFEHIRSVLNSWDYDSQNALIVTDKPNFGTRNNLTMLFPKVWHMEDLSSNMYYSQRPRQWEKQALTLRHDGQVLIGRKGILTNLCHLSEFDVYVPTQKQLSKSIKPAQKFCFAIKSQQKSSMFLSSENFVHFFSTKDKALADAWCSATQSWRGWHLSVVLGQGQKESLPKSRATLTDSQSTKKGSLSKVSGETSRVRDGVDGRAPSSSGSLLVRTSTHRNKVQDRRPEEPCEIGNGRKLEKCLRRTATQRVRGQVQAAPLIDLSPQYREPPQHHRGKGVTPEVMPAGGLVEVATSRDLAVQIPPLASWQRDRTAVQQLQPLVRSQDRDHGFPGNERDRVERIIGSDHSAFSGGRICADGQSKHDVGRSTATQPHDSGSAGPLIDLRKEDGYAPGSLLASIAKYDGDVKPPIAREKIREVDVVVGES